jgi:hypothetical protein
MELIRVSQQASGREAETIEFEEVSSSRAFVEANTIPSSLQEINRSHIIPVFIKDNEPVISHGEFIGAAMNAVAEVYHGETILKPDIRLSHPIKGRIPEARNKPAKDLLEHEKTLYYERMAFVIEVPTIHSDIAGNRLNLTIGGVKAYNLDNLYAKSGADQHFKIFVGFKNMVCTNLCVSTDGYMADLKVKNIDMLFKSIIMLLEDYQPVQFAKYLETLERYELTEQQFANLIGRCRMHKYLPENQAKQVPELLFGDGQINTVCKDYYNDQVFCTSSSGNINLWNLYNLFTGANKSTYIDNFLDRSVNAYQLTRSLQDALENRESSWFLN